MSVLCRSCVSNSGQCITSRLDPPDLCANLPPSYTKNCTSVKRTEIPNLARRRLVEGLAFPKHWPLGKSHSDKLAPPSSFHRLLHNDYPNYMIDIITFIKCCYLTQCYQVSSIKLYSSDYS